MSSRKPGPSVPAEDLEASSKEYYTQSPSNNGSKDRKSRGETTKFQLSCVPPKDYKFTFVNHWFPVQLFLTDSKKAIKKEWYIPITVDLLYDDGTVVNQAESNNQTGPVLEVSPSTPLAFNGDGQVTVQMRINQTSQWHENRTFTLRFAIAHTPTPRLISAPGDPTPVAQLMMLQSLPPCLLEGISVIRYRMKIESQPPTNWYKDEGGRDKCMSVAGVLVDETDQPVIGREVPLKVTLCYEPSEQSNSTEPTEVKNQHILRFAEGSTQKVDMHGRFDVKARIEEVSKNHQKQAFMLRISPDVLWSPGNSDIAPAYTNAVTVLSKRNKRRKKDDGFTPMMNPMSMGPMNAMGSSMHSPLSTLARQSLAMQPPVLPTDLRPSVPLTNALQNINNWCNYVIRGLNSLEWQHVGFEITENGDVHLQRPLHRCPSCWTYKDSIRPAQHNEKCMLFKAKYTFHNETQAYLQQLQMLAMGQQVKQEPVDSSNSGSKHDDSDEDSSDDGSVASGEHERSATRSNKHFSLDMPGGAFPQPIHSASSDDLPPTNPAMLPSFSQAYQSQSFMAGMNPLGFPAAGSFDFPNMPASMMYGPTFMSPAADVQYTNPEEQHVFAIYLTGGMGGEFGLAAYTIDNRCLGFYVDEGANGVNLKPLAFYQASPNWPQIDAFVKSRQAEYERAVASRQPSVIYKRDYPSIQRMKEAAVLSEYSKRQQQQ